MTASQASGLQPDAPTRSRGQRSRGGRSSRGRRGRQQHTNVDTNGHGPIDGGAGNLDHEGSQPGASHEFGSSRGRGRRGPRNSRRGGAPSAPVASTSTQRAFGGHLTSDEPADTSPAAGAAGLNAAAPSFIPGQTKLPKAPASTGSRPRRQATRASRSTASDLPTRIHEDISNGHYECVICTNEVVRNSRIWSCSICFTVTHMSCVKKWFSNRSKTTNELQQQREPSTWRCPGCNSPMTDEPSTYHCWCGKEINPKPIPGLDPHSCGQSCSKPRGTCPHPCPLSCHAGPCPPCTLMGPNQSCFCGKNTSTKRCGETNYAQGWSCHEICGDLLACGEHECQQECHPGLCGSCEVPITSQCYCGKNARDIPCEQRGDKLDSYNHGQLCLRGDTSEETKVAGWYSGTFECDQSCGRPFDCGHHFCLKGCHPQEEDPAHCPFSPDVVTHCPCGKTPLTDITGPRSNCQDAIPNCDKVCQKLLACGHSCPEACHSGTCPPCTQKMELSCRCGRTSSASICHQGNIQRPECVRVCRAQLNCGRHEHGERCCSSEKRAMERVAAKRKHKTTSVTNEEFEAEHICIRVCGRALKCGRHDCQQMCHRGPCPSCPEAIFDEISCNCGRTVLQPPQPCGTQPPECRFDCTRPRLCGHPQVSHNCHTDDKPCPKCPFLVEKRCICGKKMLKNQPCWFEEPRCGLPCEKRLKCGTHTCGKQCHRPGECEDSETVGSRCKQSCGKTRNCGHLDTEQCHAPYPCKEDKPCQAKTFVTCDCQHRKQEVRCMATKTNSSPSRPILKCDDECLRLQRNARLANALNIDPQTHVDDHVPYSDTTLKLFRENPRWAQTYEREYRVFAGDPRERRLRFKPMKSPQRAFLHALAEDFGLDSESSDPEPHRHVCLFKTPRFVAAPSKTLSQCVTIRITQDSQASELSSLAGGSLIPTEPYNALLLSEPRFGLTVEELDGALKQEYAAHPSVKFQTSFLPSDEVVIKGSGSWASQALESSLSALKPAVGQAVKRLDLAKDVFLCHVDDSLNVLRREEKAKVQGEGGWNAVVGRSAARPRPAAPAATAPLRSRFVALRREPKKKVEEAPVEEDWEVAAEHLDED
ncbi:hypothetical protein GGR56DRAFT_205545 [Xylariaceae sp. FL0804]|nr:hypothetical protein GGR56DRAFT_205545 [Xylariaceae sp. FL0804]